MRGRRTATASSTCPWKSSLCTEFPTRDLAQELAKTDRNNPPGELASQGIYKNAEDPDAAPKPKAAKKKRAPDDGAGKKAAKK